jgi:VWFA-related protein
VLAVLGLAGFLLVQAQTVPTFPAAVELVTVDAVVLDRDGNPVAGLSRDDFVVTEDGRPQEIVGFEAFGGGGKLPSTGGITVEAEAPFAPRAAGRTFAIVIDDLRLVPSRADAARKAATLFLDRSLQDGDEVTLGTTSGNAFWSARFPEGREDLHAVLARLRGLYEEPTSLDRMSDYEAYWIDTHESGPPHHAPTPAPAAQALNQPGFASSEESQGAEAGDMTGFSLRERVKKRWKDQNLCSATSCDSMVRDRAADMNTQRLARTRALLAAVRRSVEAMSTVRGRKSLLLLAEALIDDSTSDWRTVVGVARETNTALYFIDVRGLVALPGGGSAADAENATDPRTRAQIGTETTIQETAGGVTLAEETGGFAVRNTNDLAGGAARIAEESRVYYLLGFNAPDGKATQKWRKLKVEVKRAGLKVRARRGYTLRSELSEAKVEPRKGKGPVVAPAVSRALDAAHETTDLPVRAKAYVLEPRGKDTARLLVTAEFDASGGTGAGRSGKREVSVRVTGRDTGRELAFDGAVSVSLKTGEHPAWRALAREFDVPAGVALARVVVRDPSSGTLGSATERVDVPAGSALHLSTPILADKLEPRAEGQSQARPAFSAHRVFAPAGRLYCQFEVFGAASPPRVLAALAVVGPGGRVVQQAPATRIAADPDGRVVRLLGLPLDGLGDGAYELVLQVQDEASGTVVEQRESFSLAASPDASP